LAKSTVTAKLGSLLEPDSESREYGAMGPTLFGVIRY
jgi:hypothetical protein